MHKLNLSPYCLLTIALTLIFPAAVYGNPRQMEKLNRGLVAVKTEDNEVFVSWRHFGTDPDSTSYNIYRIDEDSKKVKLNNKPITNSTNYIDNSADTSKAIKYSIQVVLNGKELAESETVSVWQKKYLSIPIKPIEGYRPGDASIADLDGDGKYEIVLHQSKDAKDNSFSGVTGTPVLDAYELDGTMLWRIDLGINIREGEHYTQFMVYDLDGDGCAELACKTADGTKDGTGIIIGDKDKDWRIHDQDSSKDGRILEGPEYLTIFEGKTGKALKTVDFIPSRYPIDGWGGIGGNGGNDSYGNRCDRFLACVAYLDGEHPSLVMTRGVYGRTVLAAWDWNGNDLKSRWLFDSGTSYPPFKDASPYSGMGGHSLAVADVDEDGKDEIVYQSMVVDDNGKGLYSTGFRHGDAMHVSDMYPDRPGQEIFTVHENEKETVRFNTPGAVMRDAKTGKVLWQHSPGVDIGAGVAADIDPRYPGFEAWDSRGSLRDKEGNVIGWAPREKAFVIYWDGDLLRELLSGNAITKWNYKQQHSEPIMVPFDDRRWRRWHWPQLVADMIGDWREELLIASPDRKSLRLYTTTIPTEHRIYTLMHDPQYRLSVVWQNVAYNKPAHPSFYIGPGMKNPPKPNIVMIDKTKK